MLTHIISSLRMSVATPLLPLYAFMRWTGTPYRNHPGLGRAIVQASACDTVQKTAWHWDGVRSGYLQVSSVHRCSMFTLDWRYRNVVMDTIVKTLHWVSSYQSVFKMICLYIYKNMYIQFSVMHAICPANTKFLKPPHGTYRQLNLHKLN